MNLYNYIKKLLKREPKVEEVNLTNIFEDDEYVADVLIDDLDLNSFSNPDVSGNASGKKLMVVDDISESDYLLEVDFNSIRTRCNIDVYDEYQVIKCYGSHAGFIANKYLLSNPIIDVAILDITLGTSIKLRGGSYVEYDGIDIGITILKNNPDAKIIFCSAHTLNRRNPVLSHYFDKFEFKTGKKLEEHYVNKNSDRYSKYRHLLNYEETK